MNLMEVNSIRVLLALLYMWSVQFRFSVIKLFAKCSSFLLILTWWNKIWHVSIGDKVRVYNGLKWNIS